MAKGDYRSNAIFWYSNGNEGLIVDSWLWEKSNSEIKNENDEASYTYGPMLSIVCPISCALKQHHLNSWEVQIKYWFKTLYTNYSLRIFVILRGVCINALKRRLQYSPTPPIWESLSARIKVQHFWSCQSCCINLYCLVILNGLDTVQGPGMFCKSQVVKGRRDNCHAWDLFFEEST